MTPLIVVPDDFPSVVAGSPTETQLRALGEVTVFSERGADGEDELIRRLVGADAVLSLRAYSRYTPRVLAACPSLRLISIWGTGTDNVDLDACAARQVTVLNTPGVNAHAVAEHTLALMLAVTRRIPAMDRAVRAGEWPRQLLMQLEGKTLGVIGFGAIGRRVASLASAFGMRVLVSPRRADGGRAAQAGMEGVAVETLLRDSDIVTLHLRLGADTVGFLDGERLALMRPTAFLINTARAALIDRDALIDVLVNGKIAGAGLDVFHREPMAADDPLLTLPNVVLTPHDAGMTSEVIARGLRRAVENIEHFLSGRRSSE
jgi:phosphoglycerate dehydrogenase-like enzyme